MRRVGALALQGDFAAHARMLSGIPGWACSEVRRVAQLDELDALVLPGGESTTLLKLMGYEPWFDSLRRFHARGGALLGTCAGAILLAARVTGPEQESLGLIDLEIERNGFGRQLDSFETKLDVEGWNRPLPVAFIRAPRMKKVGEGVEVIARLDGEPVWARQDRVVACTFHSEITADDRLHRWFLQCLAGGAESADSMGSIEGGMLTAAGE